MENDGFTRICITLRISSPVTFLIFLSQRERWMNRLLFVIAFSMLCCARTRANDDSLSILRREGLLGKVTVMMRDTQNRPASNVFVKFFFENSSGRTEWSAVTDSNGMASATGRIRISAIINASSPNHHRIYHERFFLTDDTSKMKDDKWNPFETIIPLTIYEKRNPITPHSHETHPAKKIPMLGNAFAIRFTESNHDQPFAVDASKVQPGDLLVTWMPNNQGEPYSRQCEIQLTFAGGGGFRPLTLGNMKTGMTFPYELPEKGYDATYATIARARKNGSVSVRFAADENAIAYKRITGKDNESLGKFGIITEFMINFDFQKNVCRFILRYLENPNPNDRNSEFSVD